MKKSNIFSKIRVPLSVSKTKAIPNAAKSKNARFSKAQHKKDQYEVPKCEIYKTVQLFI